MLEVVIDRERWLRGEGPGLSYLLRERDAHMCCIGFACIAAGMTPGVIMSQRTIDGDLRDRVMLTPLQTLLTGRGENGVVRPKVLADLYNTNDRPTGVGRNPLSGEQREAEIIRLGKLADIAFTFIN
jgi:hypothetical protein